MAKKKSYSVDIKEVMFALDTRDKSYYSRLTEDQQKSFSAWNIMRFASSCNGVYAPFYLSVVNTFVNNDFSSLSKHPELVWKLLTISGSGKREFHPYIKQGRRAGKNNLQAFLHEVYPSTNNQELELLEKMNSKDDIIQLALDRGMSDDDIKDIFK